MNNRIDFIIPGIVETDDGFVGIDDIPLRIIGCEDGLLLRVKTTNEVVLISLDVINEKAGELCGRTDD